MQKISTNVFNRKSLNSRKELLIFKRRFAVEKSRPMKFDPKLVQVDNWARLGVSPEDDKEIQCHHDQILRDPRSVFDVNNIKRYILIEPEPELTLYARATGHMIRYIHRKSYINRFLSQLNQRATDLKLLEHFHIMPTDFAASSYFLLLHSWMMEQKFMSLGMHCTNGLFTWGLQNIFKEAICEGASHEGKIYPMEKMLRKVEGERLLFYGELDGALDDEFFAGLLRHSLWRRVYTANVMHRGGHHLHLLTVYTLRMRIFIKHLPREVFMDSEWTWPEWPPGSNAARVGIRHDPLPSTS